MDMQQFWWKRRKSREDGLNIFMQLLLINVERIEAEISTLGMEVSGNNRVPDSTNARVKEVRDTFKRMSSGKVPGKDGVTVEILKEGKKMLAE